MPSATDGTELSLGLTIVHFAIARSFHKGEWTVGLGTRTGYFTLQRGAETIFEMTGAGPEAGVMWRPFDLDMRIGVSVAGPVYGTKIEHSCVDPCGGYTPPERLDVTSTLSAGVAWRFAKSHWNRPIASKYRDERSLRLALDVALWGAVDNGISPQSYVAMAPAQSGTSPSVSIRGGGEFEWLPGRLRVRAGSYWEPGRITGVNGRLHGTAGFDVRVWQVHLWGDPYRLRLSVFGDLSVRYWNGGLSIGLWH
jgi:hypothetical protein